MSQAETQQDRPTYTTKRLAYELDQEIGIKFEEGLYTQALAFLKDLLHAGVATPSTASTREISIARPEHLAFITTLALHPTFTNRARDAAAAQVSVAALDYLRAVDRLVGPSEVRYAEAYVWSGSINSAAASGNGRSLRSLRLRQGDERTDSPSRQNDLFINNAANAAGAEMVPNSPYATTRAVWNCAGDIWAVVGWAFRCSLTHPRRWRMAWRPWLEYFIVVLEKDWNERRLRQRRRRQGQKTSHDSTPPMKDEDDDKEGLGASLFARYYGEPDARARILRAIFADGSDRSGSEFKEVWRNETKPAPRYSVKSAGHKAVQSRFKQRETNIDQDAFMQIHIPTSEEDDDEDDDAAAEGGDGDDNSSPDSGQKRKRGRPPSKEKKKKRQPRKGGIASGSDSDDFANSRASIESLAPLGGHGAGKLRLRFLSLVFRLAEVRTKDSEHDRDELSPLFSNVVDHLRPLQVNAFSTSIGLLAFYKPTALPRYLATSLVLYIVHTLIQNGQRTADATGWWWGKKLTFEMLMKQYLPFAANTNLIADNARLSLCLHNLTMLVPMHGEDERNGASEDDEAGVGDQARGFDRNEDLSDPSHKNACHNSVPRPKWSMKQVQEFEHAIEKGIAAREAKATRAKGTKGEASGSSSERRDRFEMSMSERWLRMMYETEMTAAQGWHAPTQVSDDDDADL